MLFSWVWTTEPENTLGDSPRVIKKERFFMILHTIWLAERRLIVQGIALLILRLLLDAAHFRPIHPRHRPKRFYEAGPTALGGCENWLHAVQPVPLPFGWLDATRKRGWSGFVAVRSLRTVAHKTATYPVGRDVSFHG